MTFVWLFLLLFKADVSVVHAQSARDRCQVTDCTCYVTPAWASDERRVTVEGERRQLVYFRENEDSLSSSQIRNIRDFTNGLGANISSITLMGFTDGCGSDEYNNDLARRRIQEVRSIIRSERPGSRISFVVGGEGTSYHSAAARRVDIIAHTSNSFITRIEKIPADVYLIDGSGSMWEGWRNWRDLVNISYRPGAKIYMSMMQGCRNGQSISTISPAGGTEIWYSYYWVLGRMRRGQTLLIISDFQSNYPLSANEAQIIRNRAIERGINVITVR